MLRLIFFNFNVSKFAFMRERKKSLSGLFRKVYIDAFPFVLAKSVN